MPEEHDAFGRPRAENEVAPRPAGEAEALEPLPPADWASAPADEVPPWRRADRERVEQARAGTGGGLERPEASARARELRRLTGLHADGVLTDEELVAAARRALRD